MVGKFESCWREIRFLSELDKFFGTEKCAKYNVHYYIDVNIFINSEVHLINFP